MVECGQLVTSSIDVIVDSDDASLMRYPGGKGKCYQRLINLMPVHGTYIECHLGGGAVMRHKKPAATNIGIDRNEQVIQRWRSEWADACDLVTGDAVAFLQSFAFKGDELIYADPPYVRSTRRSPCKLYRHELDDADHIRLLDVLASLPCMVMISGYDSQLYRKTLQSWRRVTFQAKTHTDLREESVWLNFDPPSQLHDGRFLGRTFRERQSVKRRHQRWIDRLDGMAPAERGHLLDLIRERYAQEVAP